MAVIRAVRDGSGGWATCIAAPGRPQRPHTSLNGLTPFAFAKRPTNGHNPDGLWL